MNHRDEYNYHQDRYIKTKDRDYLTLMYLVLLQLNRNHIVKYCKSKRIYLRNINELAHDASADVIEQYLKHPNKFIRSIITYSMLAVRKVIFKNSQVEQMEVSLYENENVHSL